MDIAIMVGAGALLLLILGLMFVVGALKATFHAARIVISLMVLGVIGGGGTLVYFFDLL